MKSQNVTYKSIEGLPNKVIVDTVASIYSTIFADADVDFFYKRLTTQPSVFIGLAYIENTIVSFKIGYQKTKTVFYSWIGGVLPEYRKQGIAQHLLEQQIEYATSKGFKTLQTKSMNRFKPMMQLNLKNGFDIVKVYTNRKQQTKIVFEKPL